MNSVLSLTVIPPSAAPSAEVPSAKTPPKKGQKLSRAALSRLARRILEAVADLSGPAALRRAGRLLWGWLQSRRVLLEGTDWLKYGRRLARYLMRGGKGRPAFNVMVPSNGKVPFWQFSTLPVFTCPGAGKCAQWCYSFGGWRQPGSFFRQLQNTLLLTFAPDVVRAALFSLPEGSEFRLYVDGDFCSLESIAFWMRVLAQRPDVRAYGYSKSWDLLREYDRSGGTWASNYVLNLSSGGVSYATREEMEALPITRDAFLVLDRVKVPKGAKGEKDKSAKYRGKDYRARLHEETRSVGLTRYFICGGDCGDCGRAKAGGPPVCGDKDATITVVIGAH